MNNTTKIKKTFIIVCLASLLHTNNAIAKIENEILQNDVADKFSTHNLALKEAQENSLLHEQTQQSKWLNDSNSQFVNVLASDNSISEYQSVIEQELVSYHHQDFTLKLSNKSLAKFNQLLLALDTLTHANHNLDLKKEKNTEILSLWSLAFNESASGNFEKAIENYEKLINKIKNDNEKQLSIPFIYSEYILSQIYNKDFYGANKSLNHWHKIDIQKEIIQQWRKEQKILLKERIKEFNQALSQTNNKQHLTIIKNEIKLLEERLQKIHRILPKLTQKDVERLGDFAISASLLEKYNQRKLHTIVDKQTDTRFS